MKKNYLSLLIILLVTGTTGIIIKSLNENKSKDIELLESGKAVILYNMQKPDKKIKLPKNLVEISALSYHKNNQLVCLHDEKANIYMVNYLKEEVEKKFNIVGKGDYEGIEIIGNTAYMLKSNGLLIEITDFTEESRIITKHKTGFSSKNDCEGLGYDPKTNKLLIACKNKPGLPGSDKKYKNKRAVYEFDIYSHKLNEKPRFLIKLKEIEKKTGKNKFMPSGIAVHPVTNNTYIIASVGKLMIVLNRAGGIIDFAHLNPDIFRQPEGICFSPDGKKLFISNEGRGKKGNILIFE